MPLSMHPTISWEEVPAQRQQAQLLAGKLGLMPLRTVTMAAEEVVTQKEEAAEAIREVTGTGGHLGWWGEFGASFCFRYEPNHKPAQSIGLIHAHLDSVIHQNCKPEILGGV